MKKYLFHNKWLTTIIAIPSLLLALFLAPKIWAAVTPTQDAESYFKNIVAGLWEATNASSKEALLKVYCKTMNNEIVKAWFKDDTIYYSSRYSLFVQALCKWITKQDTFYNPSLIKWKNWSQILWNEISWCDWNFSECKLDELLSALFNATMNDHSTLSIAWWAMNDEGKWIDDTIQKFSMTYFSDVRNICWDKNAQYISSKWAASTKDWLCSHPNTYQSLKNTIETLQKQKNNLLIIEWKWFWSQSKCDKVKEFEDYFECAYTNSTSKEAWWYQHNLWYNELLYYKLLISWLANDKLLDPKIKPLNLTKDVVVDLSDERQNLKREEILSENAVEIMQKTINNIRATFPLHIWLQVYYEDVVNFRKSLAKIYTPIHQLNYKLRNIQEKK